MIRCDKDGNRISAQEAAKNDEGRLTIGDRIKKARTKKEIINIALKKGIAFANEDAKLSELKAELLETLDEGANEPDSDEE
jgi:hypothetical protein